MLFTFGVEDSYNNPVEPSFVLDMVMEQLLLNKNYLNVKTFNSTHNVRRYEQNKDVVGQSRFEMTFGNEAWGRLFEVLLGQRVRLSNKRFRMHQNGSQLIVGRLTSDLNRTATGFNITEASSGEFDGTNTLLIGSEVIADAIISDGTVSSSLRAQLGTSADLHYSDDTVYVIENSSGIKIDVCSPKISEGRGVFDKSLTCYIYRDEEYYRYSGLRMNRFEMNLNPEEAAVALFSFVGADTTNISPLLPITTYDSGRLIGTSSVQVVSLNTQLDLRRLYLSYNNALIKNTWGHDRVRSELPVQYQSIYGQMTWLMTSIEHYYDYLNNVKHNLSLQFIDWSERPVKNVMIFNNNDMRINTFAPQYTGGLIIQDSAPFYCYQLPEIYLQYEV